MKTSVLPVLLLIEAAGAVAGGPIRATIWTEEEGDSSTASLKSLDELLGELPELSVGLRQTARFECELKAPAAQLVWLRLNRSEEVQLLSLNQKVIAPDKRLRVGRLSPLRWHLELSAVAQEDSGAHFLCQASCSPNRRQTCEGAQRFAGGAKLNVLAPPRFVASRTSASRVSAPEWRPLELSCGVEGEPSSQVTWKREDGRRLEELGLELRPSHQQEPQSGKRLAIDSASLSFGNFTRQQAGAYLCIASNGVQPGVSQRVQVEAVGCRATWDAQQEEPCASEATTTTTAATANVGARSRQAWRQRNQDEKEPEKRQKTNERRRPQPAASGVGRNSSGKVAIRRSEETSGAHRLPLISATLLAALMAISAHTATARHPLRPH